jgi:hypothetical protein
VAWHNAVEPWLRLAIAVLILDSVGGGSRAVMGAYAVAALLVLCSQRYFVQRTVSTQSVSEAPDEAKWRDLIWRNAWPMGAWGAFVWAQGASDRWALEMFATTAAVGQYAVLFQLGYTPITLATSFLITFLGPVLFQRAVAASNASRNQDVKSLTWCFAGAALALTVIGTAAAMMWHGVVFAVLTDGASSYADVSPLLGGVVFAGGLFATGQILALKPTSDLQLTTLIAPKIVTAIIAVIGNVALARSYGVTGVVASLIIASAAYALWMAGIVGLPGQMAPIIWTKRAQLATDE